jgi:hypothetical protein
MVREAMEDAFEDMLQRYREKQKELNGRIERDLKEVQPVVHLVHAAPIVSFTPSSSQTTKFGDELA